MSNSSFMHASSLSNRQDAVVVPLRPVRYHEGHRRFSVVAQVAYVRAWELPRSGLQRLTADALLGQLPQCCSGLRDASHKVSSNSRTLRLIVVFVPQHTSEDSTHPHQLARTPFLRNLLKAKRGLLVGSSCFFHCDPRGFAAMMRAPGQGFQCPRGCSTGTSPGKSFFMKHPLDRGGRVAESVPARSCVQILLLKFIASYYSAASKGRT
jgi:hypothetical protein